MQALPLNSQGAAFPRFGGKLFSNLTGMNGSTGQLSVQAHWAKFESPPPWVHALIASFLVLLTVVAISGNGLVIWILAKYRVMRGSERYLFINLAFSDMMMAVTGFPIYIITSLKHRWIYPHKVCDFYGASGALFGLMSINTMLAIAIDRHLVIVRTGPRRHRRSVCTVAVTILLVWIMSMAWAVAPILGFGQYVYEGFGTTCSFDYITRSKTNIAFVVSMIIIEFALPLSAMAYCYGSIFWNVRNSEKELARTSERLRDKVKRGSKYVRHTVNIRVTKTSLVILACFCFAWLPYTIVALIGLFGDSNYVTPLGTAMAGLFAKSSTTYNPFIYSVTHPSFRKKIAQSFFSLCGQRKFFEMSTSFITCGTGRGKSNDEVALPPNPKGARAALQVLTPGDPNEPGTLLILLEPKCPVCNYQLVKSVHTHTAMDNDESCQYSGVKVTDL